jgi:uncharacterized protein YbaP (TraB family)
MGQTVMATETTTTAETTDVESPSEWALWDVQMTYTYGLGNAETYTGYGDTINGEQFLAVKTTLESKFGVINETDIEASALMTRGIVIDALYDVIVLALNIDSVENEPAVTALNYFISQGLIYGRNDGEYALDELCTNEEMLAFSKRVYDHLTYALGLDAKGAFWKVSDENNTVYLLGSIHVTDGSVYPMSTSILEGFFLADNLVVEANILMTDPDELAYIQQIMFIEGDQTIDEWISEETYAKYVEIVEPLGLGAEIYDKLKPWYAAMLLQSLSLSETSYEASMGIDLYFLSMAYGWKPIIELEGTKYQLDMFDSFSPELQEGYLISVLESDESSMDIVGDLITAWKSGDIEELERIAFTDTDETEIDETEIDEYAQALEAEYNEKIWEVRNANMIEKIEAMLAEDDTEDYFVVVGAGHMLTEEGIVQGLEALGYTVEQVK